eukprot:SAG31_NODE_365_length_16833_cov_98.502032_1_plen_231_part_00
MKQGPISPGAVTLSRANALHCFTTGCNNQNWHGNSVNSQVDVIGGTDAGQWSVRPRILVERSVYSTSCLKSHLPLNLAGRYQRKRSRRRPLDLQLLRVGCVFESCSRLHRWRWPVWPIVPRRDVHWFLDALICVIKGCKFFSRLNRHVLGYGSMGYTHLLDLIHWIDSIRTFEKALLSLFQRSLFNVRCCNIDTLILSGIDTLISCGLKAEKTFRLVLELRTSAPGEPID